MYCYSNLNNDNCSDFIIDPVEVANCLAGINIFKAPGADGLPNCLLRDFAPYLCNFWCFYSGGVCPSHLEIDWSYCCTKDTSPCTVQTDLRPVSLLQTVAKIWNRSLVDGYSQFWRRYLTKYNMDVDPRDQQRMHYQGNGHYPWMAVHHGPWRGRQSPTRWFQKSIQSSKS